MMQTGTDVRPIVVSGDVTIDWNLARLPRDGAEAGAWNPGDNARICCQPGGAALLACVLSAMCERRRLDGLVAEHAVLGPVGHLVPHDCADFGRCHRADAIRPACPDFSACNHSYAMWEPYPETASGGHTRVWRVSEHLGLDYAERKPEPAAGEAGPANAAHVIDDAALGFRDNESLWPAAIREPDPDSVDWILVKLAQPIAQGALWRRLQSSFADRTVAITTVDDLRRQAVTVSEGISWERTAQDLYWELTNNPAVSALSTCAHTVISLGPAGALLLSWIGPDSTGKPTWDCRLVFDPDAVEGEWEADYPGGMIGYTTCLAAGVAAELLREAPDISAGVTAGVSALRMLQRVGYGEQAPEGPIESAVFPVAEVAREALYPSEKLPVTSVQDPVQHVRAGEGASTEQYGGLWTILDDLCPHKEGTCEALDSPVARIAADAVRRGLGEALEGAPICRIGNLSTVDRREAEGYRRIRRLIANYARSDQSKPLAIAVFGPPGSGKSFGVKQVARSVGEADVEDCEFNISQFAGPEDLTAALHTVRDIGLSGKTPLVFWDEFDTDGRKWLKYFLAPIQDGEFRDGQILHHVGRAIFVFAGGTAKTMAEFDRGSIEDDEEFGEAKGPDFVSRMNGYLNVMGPDPQGDEDRHYPLRRAVLLRSLLERNAGHLLTERDGVKLVDIDNGVLRAFLHVSRYKHGVRSMEAIISMSRLANMGHFERSCLPDVSQLDLHVNGDEFLALTQLPELEGDLLERLAAATHAVYRGTVGDYKGRPKHADAPYDELPKHLKESNCAFVRNIFAKLTSIGYTLMPARSGDPAVDFPGGHEDALAEAEHERWMWERLRQGYRYGPEGEDGAREPMTNPNLIPWSPMTSDERAAHYGEYADFIGPGSMDETQKQWDQDMVKSIPKVLAQAGYTLVHLEDVEGSE